MVHARFWRPQECLSLISAADMDAREAALKVRCARRAGLRWACCGTLARGVVALPCVVQPPWLPCPLI